MKKTLIAAGIAAVVATPAFADVKISGAVEQQMIKTEKAAWTGSADNSITFSASEDLGNGLTAFAKIVLDSDQGSGNAGNTATKDEVVGIKGSFGTIVTGRMEGFTEGKVMSQFTLEGDGGAGGGAVENGADGEIMADRNDHAIAYVSPTMNGFHFGVAGYTGATSGSAVFDATDVAVFYDNGPLSIKAAQENFTQNSQANAEANEYKNRAITVAYTMGDLKATVGHKKTTYDNNGEIDSTDKLLRLDYKMGNNSISLAMNDGEDYETGTENNNADVWAVELTHNFSKRSKVYVTHVNKDVDGVSADATSIGLKHKF